MDTKERVVIKYQTGEDDDGKPTTRELSLRVPSSETIDRMWVFEKVPDLNALGAAELLPVALIDSRFRVAELESVTVEELSSTHQTIIVVSNKEFFCCFANCH